MRMRKRRAKAESPPDCAQGYSDGPIGCRDGATISWISRGTRPKSFPLNELCLSHGCDRAQPRSHTCDSGGALSHPCDTPHAMTIRMEEDSRPRLGATATIFALPLAPKQDHGSAWRVKDQGSSDPAAAFSGGPLVRRFPHHFMSLAPHGYATSRPFLT